MVSYIYEIHKANTWRKRFEYSPSKAHKQAINNNPLKERKRIIEIRPEVFRDVLERLFKKHSPDIIDDGKPLITNINIEKSVEEFGEAYFIASDQRMYYAILQLCAKYHFNLKKDFSLGIAIFDNFMESGNWNKYEYNWNPLLLYN